MPEYDSCIPVTCRSCRKRFYVHANKADVHAWLQGELIQNALPYLNSSQRELLISKTCPECWERWCVESPDLDFVED